MTPPRKCVSSERRAPTVNEIFRRNRHLLETVSADEDRVVQAIITCRTRERGGRKVYCDECKAYHAVYHSCGNRHCPLCQHEARRKWIAAREAELIPVPYFHVVFTSPSEARDLALRNKRVIYDILMKSAWETMREIGWKRLKAELGAIAILHTWGQDKSHHPHVHFIVPGGGLTEDGKWKATNRKYLLNVEAMKEKFRGKFLAALEEARKMGKLEYSGKCEKLAQDSWFAEMLRACTRKEWAIHVKRVFASPRAVIRYLGNYTHRVAIANSQIVSADEQNVTFMRKDYKDGGKRKPMTLPVKVFMRRILMHVLPKGFVKIRSFGWMAKPVRRKNLARLRAHFGMKEREEKPAEKHEPRCPKCGSKRVEVVEDIKPLRKWKTMEHRRWMRPGPQIEDTS